MFGGRQGGNIFLKEITKSNTFFGGCERLKIEFMIYTYIYIHMYMYTVLEKTVIMKYLLLFLSLWMIIVECFHYFNRQWLRFLSLTLPFVSKIIVINSSNIPLLLLEFTLVEYGNPRKIRENPIFLQRSSDAQISAIKHHKGWWSSSFHALAVLCKSHERKERTCPRQNLNVVFE